MHALKCRLRLLGTRVGSLAKAGQVVAARKPLPVASASDTGDELSLEHGTEPAISWRWLSAGLRATVECRLPAC